MVPKFMVVSGNRCGKYTETIQDAGKDSQKKKSDQYLVGAACMEDVMGNSNPAAAFTRIEEGGLELRFCKSLKRC